MKLGRRGARTYLVGTQAIGSTWTATAMVWPASPFATSRLSEIAYRDFVLSRIALSADQVGVVR